MALDGGFRPPRQPVKAEWSAHWADVHLAVKEGFPVDLGKLRAGCDEGTWLQEYCCRVCRRRLTVASLGTVCSQHRAGPRGGRQSAGYGTYAGWNIARNRDLSVVWFSDKVGDVTVTRGVLVMKNVPTPDQTEAVAKIMPRVHRLCIDKTGMGIPIFETMASQFYGKVEGITFTRQTKETMATQTKRHLEERKCRLPETVVVSGRAMTRLSGRASAA